MKRLGQILWVYLLAGVAYGLFALLLLFPIHPISGTGWSLWFAIAAPVAVLGEGIGSMLFNNRTGQAVDASADGLSMTRIAYGVVVAILLMVALVLAVTEFDLVSDAAWDRHFARNW